MIISISGCKTSRQAALISLSKMEKDERIQSIHTQAIPFNTISSSLRFSVKQGKEKGATSVPAQLRIIKDETIQLLIQMPILRSEVARVIVTPDRIIVLDRMNKRYVSESMQNIKKTSSFDFDFFTLQALLTNQLFIAGKSSLSPDDYNSFNRAENEYRVLLNNTDKQGIHYDFVSDYTNRILQTAMYKNKEETCLNWSYEDFGLASNKRLFPMKMAMELTVPNDIFALNLTFNNVDIDSNFELNVAIPDGYEQIGIDQVVKLIQAF